MNTASVLFRTDPEIKTKAQKTANELGISLSVILNGFLREFIKTKTITFTTEEFTPYAKAELKKAMGDLAAGKASPTFNSAKESIEWLEKQGV
jgi:addiction module RelB/DinJ family antitoxin